MTALPSWLTDWRREAHSTAAALGMPSRKQETWKYTALPALFSVDSLKPKEGRHPGVGRGPDQKSFLDSGFRRNNGLENPITLNFIDGHFINSDLKKLPRGVMIASLSEAIKTNPEQVRTLLGPSTPGKTRSLVAINLAEFTDGLMIYVPHGVELGQPIVMHTHGRQDSISHLRVLVQLEAGARVTLVQTHAGDANSVTTIVNELDIGARAELQHYRMAHGSGGTVHLGFTESKLAEESILDHFSLALGGSLTRHEITTRLLGDSAMCHVNAAGVLGGTDQSDFISDIQHQCENGNSRQTVKHVLDDQARAVFQGKIHVHQQAQKTDGYQMNQALLLSDRAEMNTKPELEIYADDVKCSHGAAMGQLDEDALFYLQSRGIPLTQARAMLIESFLAEGLALISNDAVRDAFLSALTRKQTEAAHAVA